MKSLNYCSKFPILFPKYFFHYDLFFSTYILDKPSSLSQNILDLNSIRMWLLILCLLLSYRIKFSLILSYLIWLQIEREH